MDYGTIRNSAVFEVTIRTILSKFEYAAISDIQLSCENVTASPTLEPTIDPTNNPTIEPTLYPSYEPTINPTTSSPTISPTTSIPTSNPSISPTTPIPTDFPSINPSNVPTTNPTFQPSNIPTINPTSPPTNVPTINPTSSKPTISPTTNSPTTYQPSTSQPSGHPTIHPTNHPTSPPTIEPTTDSPTTTEPTIEPTTMPVMPPTMEPTTTTPTMHPIMTSSPTTANPTSFAPSTISPTLAPVTSKPTTDSPTKAPTFFTNDVVFVSHLPEQGSMDAFITNPYQRFVAVNVIHVKSELNLDVNCLECFRWFINQKAINADTTDVTLYNLKIGTFLNETSNTEYDIIESYLIINSVSDHNYCPPTDQDIINHHIFKPGQAYTITIRVEYNDLNNNQKYVDVPDPDAIKVTIAASPTNGQCEIANFEQLKENMVTNPENAFLASFHLKCNGWVSSGNTTNLSYNAYVSDGIFLSDTFQSTANNISSTIPFGDLSVTVLIKDEFNAISCYPFTATFPTIHDIISSQEAGFDKQVFLEPLANIIETADLGEDPGMAVSLFSVIDAMLPTDLTNVSVEEVEYLQDLVQQIITSAFETAPLISQQNNSSSNATFSGVNTTEISVDNVNSVISTLTQLTVNEVLLNDEVIDDMVHDYIPTIYQVFDVFINQNSDGSNRRRRMQSAETEATDINNTQSTVSIADSLFEMVNGVQVLLVNVEMANGRNGSNGVADDIMELSLYGAHVAVADSFPGEVYYHVIFDNITNVSKIITGSKYQILDTDANHTVQCGLNSVSSSNTSNMDNIVVPITFTNQQSGSTFDCSFVKSGIDNFKNHNESDFSNTSSYQPVSDIVAVNLYTDYDGNSNPIEIQTDNCDPYLITISIDDPSLLQSLNYTLNHSLLLNEEVTYPTCNFWNTSEAIDGKWSTEGCFVQNISFETNTVTCGCTHLSTFQASANQFVPRANFIAGWHFRQLTAQNLTKYPVVWITLLSSFVIVFIIGILAKDKADSNRSILAYEDIVWKEVKDEKTKGSVIGKQLAIVSKYMPNRNYFGNGINAILSSKNATKSLCRLQCLLYAVFLQNQHTLLSVFQRAEGTNFSSRQRLACFFMYLCTITAASATVYGVEQKNLMGDITASFLISLAGTLPPKFIKYLFLHSKSRIMPRKFTVEDQEQDLDGDEHEEVPLTPEGRSNKKYSDALTSPLSPRSPPMLGALKRLNTKRILQKYKTTMDLLEDKQAQKSKAQQIKVIDEVRASLFELLYPFPNRTKKLAWCLLTGWTLCVCFMSVLYGLQFDLTYVQEPNPENQHLESFEKECWENDQRLNIENALATDQFVGVKKRWEAKNDYFDNYEDIESESLRWLISCLQSLILSLFIWQPLTIYITTWLKIWTFSWNLPMEIGPRNIWHLLRNICRDRCYFFDVTGLPDLDGDISDSDSEHKDENDNRYWIFAHKDRPLDLFTYVANDELFLQHNHDNGSSNKHNSSNSMSVSLELSNENGNSTKSRNLPKGRTMLNTVTTHSNETFDVNGKGIEMLKIRDHVTSDALTPSPGGSRSGLSSRLPFNLPPTIKEKGSNRDVIMLKEQLDLQAAEQNDNILTPASAHFAENGNSSNSSNSEAEIVFENNNSKMHPNQIGVIVDRNQDEIMDTLDTIRSVGLSPGKIDEILDEKEMNVDLYDDGTDDDDDDGDEEEKVMPLDTVRSVGLSAHKIEEILDIENMNVDLYDAADDDDDDEDEDPEINDVDDEVYMEEPVDTLRSQLSPGRIEEILDLKPPKYANDVNVNGTNYTAEDDDEVAKFDTVRSMGDLVMELAEMEIDEIMVEQD